MNPKKLDFTRLEGLNNKNAFRDYIREDILPIGGWIRAWLIARDAAAPKSAAEEQCKSSPSSQLILMLYYYDHRKSWSPIHWQRGTWRCPQTMSAKSKSSDYRSLVKMFKTVARNYPSLLVNLYYSRTKEGKFSSNWDKAKFVAN